LNQTISFQFAVKFQTPPFPNKKKNLKIRIITHFRRGSETLDTFQIYTDPDALSEQLPGSRRGSYLSMTSNIDSLEKKTTFFQFAVTSIHKSVPLSIVLAFPSIQIMFCFFWIGYFNESSMTAALGLSMSC
jgi:hypothetical protein